MKNVIITLLVLLSSSTHCMNKKENKVSSTLAVSKKSAVKLPSAEILNRRFYGKEFAPIAYVIQETDIFEKLANLLANRKLTPSEIETIVDSALIEVDKQIKKYTLAQEVKLYKPLIIAAILKDYPQAKL